MVVLHFLKERIRIYNTVGMYGGTYLNTLKYNKNLYVNMNYINI